MKLTKSYISELNKPTYENLMKVAIDSSDAVIKGSENISSEINDYLKNYTRILFLSFSLLILSLRPYTGFYDNNLLS